MNTTNTDILKSFYSVTNRNQLTEEIYQILLKRWELDNFDLSEEMIKINAKQSTLTKSRREAVPEFIKLRSILDQKREAEENAISMNASDDTIDVDAKPEEIIVNQSELQAMPE